MTAVQILSVVVAVLILLTFSTVMLAVIQHIASRPRIKRKP